MKKYGWIWSLVLVWCLCALPASGRKKEARAPQGVVELSDVRLMPDVPMNEVRIELTVSVPKAGKYTLTCTRSCYADEDPDAATLQMPLRLKKGENEVSALLDMGENPHQWSEFHPDLYSLHLRIEGKKGVGETDETLFLRQWEEDDYAPASLHGMQWTLNGLAVLLRPLSASYLPEGTPAADAPSSAWLRFFREAQAKGFNHWHPSPQSVTPALLAAADTVGFYLHIDEPDTLERYDRHPSVMPHEPHADTLLVMAPLSLDAEVGRIYLADDTIKGDILLYNFTEDDHRQPVHWQLQSISTDGEPDGHFATQGEEDYVDAFQGQVTHVGTLCVPLSGLQAPRRLLLTLSTQGATSQRFIDVRPPRAPAQKP